MSDVKFTKGEWRVRGSEIGVVDKSDTQSYGMMLTVAKVDEYDFPNEFKANAYLISAAPEMYEFIEMVAEGGGADLQALQYMAVTWVRNAEKILAKARGE